MCLIGARTKAIPPALANVTLNCRNGMLRQQVGHKETLTWTSLPSRPFYDEEVC